MIKIFNNAVYQVATGKAKFQQKKKQRKKLQKVHLSYFMYFVIIMLKIKRGEAVCMLRIYTIQKMILKYSG